MEKYAHENLLFREGQMVLVYVIPEFLETKEVCRFAATCKAAKAMVATYFAAWQVKLNKLAIKYKMDMIRGEADPKEDRFYVIDKR